MSIKSDLNKYTPRDNQKDCLDFIKKTYKEKSNKFFLLDLPTGVGKSHLAMMIADWYTSTVNRGSKADIITAGKILQDQYGLTYESINNLKGKENYNCTQYDCSCASGKEFNKLNKTSCDFCPYDDARDGYIAGKLNLTNFHLYLTYSIYNTTILEGRDSGLLIVDECHLLDEVLSDFISIKITENVIKRLKFTNEGEIIKRLKKVSNITGYVTFLEYFLLQLKETISELSGEMKSDKGGVGTKRSLKINKLLNGQNKDIKIMQILQDLRQYVLKVEVFLKEYAEDPDNWVLESNFNEKTNSKELSLEPLWAYNYLDKYVWSNYDMVVLMSGTILDRSLFSELNGLDKDSCAYYSIPSPFPVENRIIYYMPLGKMSYQNKEQTFKNYIPFIKKILNKYDGKKGIIHTNSFELANWIQREVENDRLLFHDSGNKEEILKFHMETEYPRVIVSPSVGTGVSFDHEKSRFQIVAKVPYPSLASQKNKMRQKNNPGWYTWRTVCDLIQIFGRSVRSKTDYADTLILDGSFGDILKYSSDLLPDWLQESIKRVNIK
jgi:ATP-dependent DNA helicase DinG